MRLSSVVFLLGAGLASAYAAAHPTQVMDLYEALYPSDPHKRQALEQCFLHDHNFNRADPGERDACYKQVLAGPGPASARELPPPRAAEPDFIDLYRAQGHGHLPQNDVRYQQQNDRYVHPPGK